MPPLYASDPFLALQQLLVAPWLDGPMSAASIACEGWAIAVFGAAFLLARERGRTSAIRAAIPLIGALLLAGLVVQVTKRLVDVPRPLAVLGADAVHVLLQPLRGHSFPSGHAASVAALAAWGVRRHGRAAWSLVLLALVGGVSRVYVGAHWAFDVLAGWAVGVAAVPVAEALWAIQRARLVNARRLRLRLAFRIGGLGAPR